MEKQINQTEKIKKFSKIVYILLRIAFIVFIVVGALELFTWILTIGKVEPIFKLGNTEIYLYPVVELGDNDIGGSLIREWLPTIGKYGFEEILRTVFIIIALKYSMGLFKTLKTDGSPFRGDVVKALKKLAVVLLIVGCVTGIVGFLASGIAWVLYLIFGYGCQLQAESDTTL